MTTKSGARFSVNKKVAANFQGFLNELEATGYKIDASQSGGYNDRTKQGLFSEGVLNRGEVRPIYLGEYVSPPNVVALKGHH